MLELPERYSYNGQSVAWGRLGAGEPVILVHGFPWSAQAWRRIAPWLARTHEVYVYDMLGTGLSEKAEGQDVTERVQGALLAKLIDHWGLEAPQVVGHDFGGLATLRAHFVHGVAFGRMHLINAVALLPSGSPFYAHVGAHEAAFAGLPDYAHEALFRAYIQAAAHRTLPPDVVEMYLEPWRGPVGRPAFYRQIAQAEPSAIEEVEALYAPPAFDVHVAWGMRDTFIPPERGEALRDRLGARSFVPIPDAAHLVHEDAPEALVGFLSETVRG